MTFTLSLLGPPSLVDSEGRVPPSLGWGKPLALLSLLAVRTDMRREEVVDLLWRDIDEAKARNAFRQALHRLRGALGEDLIPQDRERLRLAASDKLSIDVALFEESAAAGRLDAAVALYSGDFLEGVELGEPAFDTWAEQERARIQTRLRQVLVDSTTRLSEAGNWSDAIARSRRLLAVAPYDAAAAQLAATTLISAGRRAEAQELLRLFASRLQSELGLPLPPELQSLATRIERQRPVAGPPRDATGNAELQLPLSGRESELSQALSLWRTTREDAGGLILLEGEPGIGKSRLVRELASNAKALGPALVLVARERASGVPLPYGLFVEALRPLVRAKGVAGASRHLLAEAARLLPELRDTFELPAVSDIEDDASRVRFFEGVAALMDASAFETPLLVVLEDLQTITPSSLDLLSYLTVRLAGSAVLFVLTVRAAEAPSATLSRLRALAESGPRGDPPHGARAQRRLLAALTNADSFAAVTAAAGTIGLDAQRVGRLVQRAAGNPARLAELLRRAGAGEEIATLPVNVRDLVAARLEQLSSAQRRLLVVIAMMERPVSTQLAADAAHLSTGAAREAIAHLVREGLVERAGDDTVVAADSSTVAVLESAGPASRRFLAAWIAEALARDPRIAAADIGRYYAAAGQVQQAFDSARKAAYDALAVGAVAEAVQVLGWARTFATTHAQQEQVESMLTALGSGRRRLGAASTPEPVSRPEPVDSSAEPSPTKWFNVLFPNWRILLGAAIATLVISAVVLSSRIGTPSDTARRTLPDTLVVADGEKGQGLRYVTGDAVTGLAVSERVASPPSDPPWLDSLPRPWEAPEAAPGGRFVALRRVTATGTDVYVISTDRRDTIALIVGSGDARPLAWSPDGRWLLASAGRERGTSAFASGLRAYRLVAPRDVVAIDTVPAHAVTEAAWSPDGSRIAWVARVGDARQLEVFTSQVDGGAVQNISRHPADDQHIAWSGDGDLLAFTSLRDGNAELYAMDMRENRLWRLTRDPAQDDNGAFSRDGRLIAFESTRGGTDAVYVMPGLGGDAMRVSGTNLGIAQWFGGRRRYIARVRVDVGNTATPGDTTRVRLAAFDQFDEPLATRDVRWSVLDSGLAQLAAADSSAPADRLITAKRAGLARVVGSVGSWRFDTVFMRIGTGPLTVLESATGAGNPLRHWRPLGSPAPAVAPGDRSAIVLSADREWDSGILSRQRLPLIPGLVFSASLTAPAQSLGDASASIVMAIVAPEDESAIAPNAPQFLNYASFVWSAEAERFVYSVGREHFSEPVSGIPVAARFLVQIAIEPDSTVAFSVNGQPRWRSALRVVGGRNEPRAQLWIGGRATGERVRVSGMGAILRAASDAPR